jgi:hypothetical protein
MHSACRHQALSAQTQSAFPASKTRKWRHSGDRNIIRFLKVVVKKDKRSFTIFDLDCIVLHRSYSTGLYSTVLIVVHYSTV